MAFGVQGDYAPVGFQSNPPAVTAGFQVADVSGKVEFARADFDACGGRFAAFAFGILDVHVDDMIGKRRKTVADRIFSALKVEAIAGIPYNAQLG